MGEEKALPSVCAPHKQHMSITLSIAITLIMLSLISTRCLSCRKRVVLADYVRSCMKAANKEEGGRKLGL